MRSGMGKAILVVDDDAGQRSLIDSFLGSQGFRVSQAASAGEALAMLPEVRPDMLISDVRMPGLSGLALLERVNEQFPGIPVLLVTAYAEVRDAVGAIRSGAVDYLEKPIDLDDLLATVCRTLGIARFPSPEGPALPPLPAYVVARSETMQAVFREAALAAPSDTRLLITGESGTGKEVVADAIHRWSHRASGPFVKVNCAAIPENLLESELFGHEKGAFTGAVTRRIGRFEEADRGTLLLDEIGEMPLALQAKLLRVIQDGAFSRIGSNTEMRGNVRVLAATNRDLDAEVEAGRFRDDLFYRLNVMEIQVPPLRDRREDIVPLAQQFAAEISGGRPRFSPAAMARMERYGWPGNVRELRNAVERAILLARGEVILEEHLPRRVQPVEVLPSNAMDDLPEVSRMEHIERAAILQALRDNQFNRTAAARALGISRRTLTYRLREYRAQGYPIDSEG